MSEPFGVHTYGIWVEVTGKPWPSVGWIIQTTWSESQKGLVFGPRSFGSAEEAQAWIDGCYANGITFEQCKYEPKRLT